MRAIAGSGSIEPVVVVPVAAEVRVQPGGEQLGRRPRDGAGAGDVGEEPRVPHQQRLLEGELAQVGDELVDRHRLLGHRQRDRGRHIDRVELAVDRQLREPLEQLGPEVEHLAAELARLLRTPGEVGHG